MFVTRLGTSMKAVPLNARKDSKRKDPNMDVNKPFPDELSVSWLHKQLVDLTPRNSESSELFKWEYLCNSLLSKLPLPLYDDKYRENAAIEKLKETEKTCRLINHYGLRQAGFGYSAERFNTVIDSARSMIRELMGDLSMDIFEYSRFSSGGSTSRRKTFGDPWFKYNTNRAMLHVTPLALPYAIALIKCTPLWGGAGWHPPLKAGVGVSLQTVPGNRVFTVPKKTGIDRTCASEPDMNMSLQLAIGSHLRYKLKSLWGVDLNDQRYNQRLAKVGSKNGSLATIDLSSASDTISCRLVRELLPYDWFALLDDVRSHEGTLPNGDVFRWEKFSSMGNGFTFELESMIFYALTYCTLKYEVDMLSKSDRCVEARKCLNRNALSVYGDDIICPSKYASSVISVLNGCGFKTNAEKTFVTGPFRESCGKHYHYGVNVTPFYVKSAIDDVSRVIWLLNRLRNWAYCELLEVCDSTVWDLYNVIRKLYVPKRLKGGKNIESTLALCSPGRQQDKLVLVNEPLRIYGRIALLRSFQFNNSRKAFPAQDAWWKYNRVTNPFMLVWLAQESVLYDDRETNDRISMETPAFFRYSPNEEQWAPIPRFSEEIERLEILAST